MFLGRRRNATAGAPRPSALDELLVAEQEIAAQMAAAEQEAAGLVAAARTDAAAIESAAATALAKELADLETRDAAARLALTRALEEEGARLVTRYRSLGDEEIGRLAMFVISDITGLAGASAP